MDSDTVLKARALRMYANWIETENPLLSARDVEAMGKHATDKINVLDREQQRLVVRLHDLADEVEQNTQD